MRWVPLRSELLGTKCSDAVDHAVEFGQGSFGWVCSFLLFPRPTSGSCGCLGGGGLRTVYNGRFCVSGGYPTQDTSGICPPERTDQRARTPRIHDIGRHGDSDSRSGRHRSDTFCKKWGPTCPGPAACHSGNSGGGCSGLLTRSTGGGSLGLGVPHRSGGYPCWILG